MHSGPPDKWTDFKVNGMTSEEILGELNQLAKMGYTGAAVAVNCLDGTFVFVGGYSDNQS